MGHSLPTSNLTRLIVRMRPFKIILLLAAAAIAQAPSQEIPVEDAIRIKEFTGLLLRFKTVSGPTGARFPRLFCL